MGKSRWGSNLPNPRHKTTEFVQLALFFTLAFILPISTAVCLVDQNQSLGDIRKLPENYYFSCDFRFNPEIGSPCLETVDRFCILSMVNDTISVESKLDYTERIAFDYTLSKLRNASYSITKAYVARTTVFQDISEAIRNISCIPAAQSWGISFLFHPIAVGCIINEWWYESNTQSVLNYIEQALEESNKGINYAMQILQNEADELYCMGAGNTEYTGPERNTYLKVKDIIIDSRVEVDVSENYTSLPKKWAALLKNSWNMHDYFYTTDQTCTASVVLNSELGESGVLPSLLVLYEEVKLAKQSLIDSYQNKSTRIFARINKVKADLAESENQNYNVLNTDEINFFLTNWSQGFEAFPDPARMLQNISDTIYTGIGDNAQSLYAEGISIHANSQKFYISDALQKFKESEEQLDDAEKNLAELDASIDSLLSDANDKTSKFREVARKALDGFKLKEGTSETYITAESKFESGDKRYLELKFKPKGEQIHEYYLAYSEFKLAYSILSKTDIQDEYFIARNSCNYLSKTISFAKIDDIDITGAAIVLEAAVSSLNKSLERGGNSSEFRSINEICTAESESLYSIASIKYQYLLKEREKIKEVVSLLKNLGEMDSQKEGEFTKVETYISLGNFSKSALGNYKKIDLSYDSIYSDFNKKKSAAFANYFASHTYIKEPVISSIIYVGQKVEILIPIEVRNALSISSNESFMYRVTSIGLGPDDNVTVSNPIIDVTGDSTGMNIFFKNISANSFYYITLTKKETTVSSSEQVWTRTFLDFTELRERKAFELVATRDIGNIVFNTTYARPADSCEAYLNGEMSLATVKNITVSSTFTNLRKGKTVGYVECYTANPITITRANYTLGNSSMFLSNSSIILGNSSITYEVYVKSNIGNLDNVWITYSVSSPIEGESVRIYNSNWITASESSYTKYNNEYLIKWKIPSLSGNFVPYYIVFKVSDVLNYVKNKRDEVAAKATANSVNISSYLDRADAEINTLQYKEALNTLNAAERIVDDYISLKSKKDVLLKQANLLYEKMTSAASNTSALVDAGLVDAAVELDKKRNEFEREYEQFNSELNSDNTANAANTLRELESISDLKSVDNLFYKKNVEVFEDFNNLRTNLNILSKIKDMSAYIDELKSIEPKRLMLSEKISEKDYASVPSILSEITSIISKIRGIEQSERENLTSFVSTKLKEIKELNSTWKDVRARLLKTIEVETSNPGNTMNTFDLASIDANLSYIDRTMSQLNGKYSLLKTLNTSEIISRIDEINALPSDIETASESIQYLSALANQYKTSAENSFQLGRTTLENVLSEISSDEAEKASQLTLYLNKASQSLRDGQYLNSILYSDYVHKNADSLKKKTELYIDPVIPLVVIIVIASILLTVFLLRKEDRKETRELEKVQD